MLVGAGDIAGCGPELADAEATARLLDSISGTIFTAGDNTQTAGTAQEFRDCYSPTWGRHKDRIRPAPGNHDWQTAGGAAYFDYFGSAAGPAGLGYYSYDLGAWHVISLNGNVSMKAGSAQANWLRQDLEASQARCTLAYWHQPLFTSSVHGYDATSLNAWQLLYDYGAEIVLNGHDHIFERFAPQDPSGRRDDAHGIRQFTVGTGGYGLYPVVRLQPNSEVQGMAHGVLKLTLRGDSYDWQFIPAAGVELHGFRDPAPATPRPAGRPAGDGRSYPRHDPLSAIMRPVTPADPAPGPVPAGCPAGQRSIRVMNRTAKRAIACACLVLPLVVMTVVRAQVQAPKDGQGKYLTLAGYRHGPSAFTRNFLVETTPLQPGVMDFKHYHTYTEQVEFLKKWAKDYPDLVDLYVVAQSFGGIDIYQVTLTNKKTGKDTDKPAMYVEGNRHAGEVTAAESALWMLNYLLTNYGKNAEATRLVDNFAFYFRPVNNPDGNLLYLETAQTLRSTIRPYDNDRDGLLDEDPAEDLDGDGFIRQMRVKVEMGKGDAVIDERDPKGRLMRRVGAGKGDYLMLAEGYDNDGDGRVNEDGPGGLDLHRNYPENWRPETEATGRGYTQGGAGEYPLSEIETRAVVTFLLSHPNVSVVNTMDTTRADAAPPAVHVGERRADVPGGPRSLQDVRHEGQGHHRLRAGGRRVQRLRARQPALRPQPRLRLLAVRRHLVRRRVVERRQRRRLQQGRRDRRARSPAVQRQGTEGQPLPAVDEDHPPAARRGGGRRLEPEVLEPEPAARDPRDVGRARGALQPDARRQPAQGGDGRAEDHRAGRRLHDRGAAREPGLHPDRAQAGAARPHRPGRHRVDGLPAGHDVGGGDGRARRLRGGGMDMEGGGPPAWAAAGAAAMRRRARARAAAAARSGRPGGQPTRPRTR